jgi:hypothetical protein
MHTNPTRERGPNEASSLALRVRVDEKRFVDEVPRNPDEAPQSPPPYAPDHDLPELTSEATNWAMLCHLSGLLGWTVPTVGHVLGPLVVWLIKRDAHPFIDDQGKEALNFQISMTIYMLVAAVTLCAVVGIVLVPVAIALDLIFPIIAAVKASSGETYRYPLTIRFVK